MTYVVVLVIAGLLILNLGIRSAWAEKGGSENKNYKDHAKEQKENQASDNHRGSEHKGSNSEKSGNNPPPEQSPSPQQQDPPTNSQADNTRKQAPQPAQPPQSISAIPPTFDRKAEDSIAITDAFGMVSANYPRHISDRIAIDDGGRQLSLKKTSAPISLGSEIKITDQISTSGIASIPAVPRITVTSPPLLQVSSDQQAEITFDSTAAGMYSIIITSDSGPHISQTLSGEMQVGANSVAWDGKKESGVLVPAGQYTYSITAMGNGGVRQPPQQGDGSILVLGPTQTSDITIPLLEPGISLPIIVTIAGIAGAILLLARARRKSLTLYLPAEATSIVDDIMETYPQARVEDYFEATPDGPKRYVGITIPNPKDGNGEWQSEIAENVRAIAGVDPIKLRTKGKMRVL